MIVAFNVFFSAQAFYGNYSTLDSHTNTVKDDVIRPIKTSLKTVRDTA